MLQFDKIWKDVTGRGLSCTTEAKLRRLYLSLVEVSGRNVPGSLAEVGTYQGCSARVISSCFRDRVLHCYDTFEGIVHPRRGELDKGSLAVGIEIAQKYLEGLTNVRLHKGVFPSTFDLKGVKFAFVYSDTDTYFGTKATLVTFMPLMSPGGAILVDDVGNKQCPFIEDALNEVGVKFEFYADSQQAIIRM